MRQNRPYISSYGVEPLVTHNVSGTGQITTYRLKDYTEELAVQNEMRKQDPFISHFLTASLYAERCSETCISSDNTEIKRRFYGMGVSKEQNLQDFSRQQMDILANIRHSVRTPIHTIIGNDGSCITGCK